jgi:hypothetical protein
VQEADIRGLLARSEIAADTLVWRDGLSNWTEVQSTELSGFSPDDASSLPRVSIGAPSRHPSRDMQLSRLRRHPVIRGFSIGCWNQYRALIEYASLGASRGRSAARPALDKNA